MPKKPAILRYNNVGLCCEQIEAEISELLPKYLLKEKGYDGYLKSMGNKMV
jgi:hypothetical protein